MRLLIEIPAFTKHELNSFFANAQNYSVFVPGLLFAFGIARREKPVEPDFKEWVGRVLLILMWLQAVELRLLVALYPEIRY